MDDAETPKPQYDGADLARQGQKWMERIRASEKRESRWRKDAEGAEKTYAADGEAKNGKCYDFNILFSNVETIVPAIYNSTPVPDIRRRFVEAIGEAPKPPQMPQQGQPGAPPVQPDQAAMMQFQQAMQAWQAKQQADADAKNLGDMIERVIACQIDDNRLDREIESLAQDAFLSGRGIVRVRFDADDQGEVVSGERIAFEAVSWRDFRMGPATRWSNVPWVAFRHTVSRETLERHTDADMYAAQGPDVPTMDDDGDDIPFWEVWCSETRSVHFVREHDGKMLNTVDDPLGLPGFFPIPEPVQPITLTAKMTPVTPFSVYRKLADELDLATRRINALMKGLKAKGIFAGNPENIKALAAADDNELVTATDLDSLAQTGGLEKAILWWPLDKIITVTKELYVQREQIKQAIYEITGISDIVRGASAASETATAQQIKTQWGSLRIQKMQRLVERQVRDVFVMMAHLIITKFSPETLMQMSGIPISEGMQALMASPTLAGYRIDVESDSTIRADMTRQKGEAAEFLKGTGQFFGAMGPVIQESPEMAEPMAEVYASFARLFKLGKQAEDALERMSKLAKEAPKQPRPNPEAEKAKAEMALKQQDAQIRAQESQARMAADERKAQMDAVAQARSVEVEREKAQIGLQVAQVTLAIKQEELAIKREEAGIRLREKAASAAISTKAKADAAKQQNGARP